MNCKCKAIIKVVSPQPAKIICNNVTTITLMPKDATAIPEDVMNGKIFYNNYGRQVGTYNPLSVRDINIMTYKFQNLSEGLMSSLTTITDEDYINAENYLQPLYNLIMNGGSNE